MKESYISSGRVSANLLRLFGESSNGPNRPEGSHILLDILIPVLVLVLAVGVFVSLLRGSREMR